MIDFVAPSFFTDSLSPSSSWEIAAGVQLPSPLCPHRPCNLCKQRQHERSPCPWYLPAIRPMTTNGSPPRYKNCSLIGSGMHPDVVSYAVVNSVQLLLFEDLGSSWLAKCVLCYGLLYVSVLCQADLASTIELFRQVITRRLRLQIGYARLFPAILHLFAWPIKLIAPLGERPDQNTCPELPMSTLKLFHTTTAIS